MDPEFEEINFFPSSFNYNLNQSNLANDSEQFYD